MDRSLHSQELLIVFMDLSRFAAQTQRVPDTETAEVLQALYAQIATAVQGAGGTVVKFIGDATLAVFPEARVETAIAMLLDLTGDVDRYLEERGWECRLTAKVHFGEVVAGEFGPAGSRQFDVLGRAVNETAMLRSLGITLSNEAFRKLTPEMRRDFRKLTPPVTYIRKTDRARWRAPKEK